jgi:carbonic anhydrase
MLRTLARDLTAGTAVFFVAVPLCLGIAHASGAPLVAGLVSGIVGGVVVGLASGSALAVTGPAAGLTAVILAASASLGSFEAVLSATLLAGALQVAMGALRLGRLASLLPASVVRGMLAAIGVLLIVKQLPHLAGYDIEQFGVDDFFATKEDLDERAGANAGGNTLTVLRHALTYFEAGALGIGCASLAALVLWDKTIGRRWKVPAAIVVVPLAAVGAAVMQRLAPAYALSSEHLVQLPALGSLELRTPALAAFMKPALYSTALTIAIVASLETLLSVEAVDRLDPQRRKTPPNRELVAQGAGNVLTALCGGLPMTAVIARSSVNLQAGAQRKTAAVFHGALLFLALALFTPLINRIPLAALAAVLVQAGLKLVAPREWWQIGRRSLAVSAPFFATLLGILFSDLLVGIAIGLLVAAFFIMRGSYRAAAVQVHDHGKITEIALGEQVHFLHKARLEAILDELRGPRVVEINGAHTQYIDPDILDVIETFRAQAPARGIDVVVGGFERLKQKETFMADMRKEYDALIAKNRQWVSERLSLDPTFFTKSVEGQAPHFLFIGCSDSRVPIETITQTEPGEIFVHRNIANVVSSNDINLLSVLQYSVEVLNVRHLVVCGHYGCGGVRAALSHRTFGLIDNWIAPIKRVVEQHARELSAIADPEAYERRVIELHVTQQVRNLMQTSIVQKATARYGFPQLHGWVYDLQTGLINDLELHLDVRRDFEPVFRYD